MLCAPLDAAGHPRAGCGRCWWGLWRVLDRAAGYVRPICLSYVTSDNHKLMKNFKVLLKHFTDVSNILKTGNYELFREDLKKRMADLAYTKQVVETSVDANMVTAATPGIISRHFEDMVAIRERMRRDAHILEEQGVVYRPDSPRETASVNLEQIAPGTRSRSLSAAKRLESSPSKRGGGGGGGGVPIVSSKPASGSDGDTDSEQLEFQAPLNGSWAFIDAEPGDGARTPPRELEAVLDTHARGRQPPPAVDNEVNNDDVDDDDDDEADHLGEVMVNIVRALGIEHDYKPRVIQSLHKSRTMSQVARLPLCRLLSLALHRKSLRTLSELCGAHHVQAMDKLERIRQHFSLPSLALALQAQDAAVASSSPCSALVVGGVPLVNLNWRLKGCAVQLKQQAPGVGIVSSGTDGDTTEGDELEFRSFAQGSLDGFSAELVDQTMAYAHGVVLASRAAGCFARTPLSTDLSLLGKHLGTMRPPSSRSTSASSDELPFVGQAPQDDLQQMSAANFVSAKVARASTALESIASVLWPATAAAAAGGGADADHPASAATSPSAIFLLRRFSFSKHAIFSILKVAFVCP